MYIVLLHRVHQSFLPHDFLYIYTQYVYDLHRYRCSYRFFTTVCSLLNINIYRLYFCSTPDLPISIYLTVVILLY
jgi:hypothetical protein